MRKPRIDSFFESNNVDSFIVLTNDFINPNFHYLTGLRLDNTVLLSKKKSKPTLLVNKINMAEAKRSDFKVLVYSNSEEFWERINAFFKEEKNIGFDGSTLSAGAYLRLKRKLKNKKLRNISEPLLSNRSIKQRDEITFLRKSVKVAKDILHNLRVVAGKTELQLSNELRLSAISSGVELSFEPIVLSGRNSSMPHGKPSKKKISSSDTVLVDFGVKYGGYCSDLSRCFLGSKEKRERYHKLQSVLHESVDLMGKGTRCSEVPDIVNSILKKKGFGGKMIHSPGHGIGLQVHELPVFGNKSKAFLEESMVFALEPAVYGKYGLRYEENLVIVNGKASII